MKKRILSIFDIRRKKLGVALVSLMLCASLGAGMAFALQTAGEPAGSAPPAVVSEPATDEERAYALNLLWLQKLDEVFDGYSSLNQTSIRSYMLAYDEVDEAEYERIRQVLLAMEDQHDVADMMRSGDFAIVQPSEEVQAFAREVVDAAGYEDWMIEGISLTLYPYGYAYDFEAATEFDTYWRIDLVEDSSEDASLATFWLKGDDKLYRMEQMADYRHEELRSLTQDERSQVLDRVLTYLRKYLYYLPEQEEHILQSDKVYQKNHIPEPVTAVWYFDGQEPYDVANEDEIIGYVIIIGVDTGRIYNIGWENDQASFANRWRAEKDWTETTGKAFPYPNQYYLWEIVSVEMTQLLDDLYARYADTLSDQEQLLFYVLRSEDAAALEAPNSHWPELMTVLRACETEQDFKDFLATRFIGINQSPPDEPQAEAILKRAEPSFEAIGAGEMRNRAFMYSTSFCSQAPGTYSVSAMDTFQRDNKYKLSFITTIGVDKEGMIVGLYYQGIYGDGALLVEATDEQKEAAKEIALAMIESGRIALATYDLDTLRVAQQVETSTDNITRAKVTVHTLFYLEDENGNRTDETEQGLLSMTVGLENGRLYGLERYFETNIDLEDTETHIHMARNG